MNKVSIIDSYLNRCAEEHTTESAKKLVNDILGVFSNDINGLTSNLDLNDYTRAMTGTPVNYIGDVELLSKKLEFYKSMLLDEEQNQKVEFEKLRLKVELAKGNITVQNTNHNENHNTMTVTFESVREAVDNMTSLPDEEIQEVKNKVDELEAITKSKDSKSKKWSKANDIIKWVADKGVDVGIALLPLILQIK